MQNRTSELTYFDLHESIKYTDIGVASSVDRLVLFIKELFPDAEWDALKIAISLSGASNEAKNQEYCKLLASKLINKKVHPHIESDSTFTLKAAYPNAEGGYLLIAGTGSVALARGNDGVVVKAGGWGRLLGDQGSGYWLGLESLKYFVRALDGAEDRGEFSNRIDNELSAYTNGFADLRRKLYSNELNPSIFVPILFLCYQDKHAQNILRTGAKYLAEMIGLLQRKSLGDIDKRITFHGSVATNPVYLEMIATELHESFEIRLLSHKDVLDHILQEAEKL